MRYIIESFGAWCLLVWKVWRDLLRHGVSVKETVRQVAKIGTDSLAIVLLTSAFSGMVLALQTAYGLQRFGAKLYVGNVVGIAMLRELGPVLTAVVVCGRVGAGIAAEIGSMVVTEQVDAIRSLGADPIRKLVTPKIIAALIALPLLVAISNWVGILGGGVVAVFELGLPWYTYYRSLMYTIWIRDFFDGLVKSAIFGFIIVSIACFKGLNCRGGTEGVGAVTTASVVTGSMAIFVANLFITKLLIMLS